MSLLTIAVARLFQGDSLTPVEAEWSHYENDENGNPVESMVKVSLEHPTDSEIIFIGVEISQERARDLGILDENNQIVGGLALTEQAALTPQDAGDLGYTPTLQGSILAGADFAAVEARTGYLLTLRDTAKAYLETNGDEGVLDDAERQNIQAAIDFYSPE